MKVLLEVKDDKVSFIMELLNNFTFVKAKPISSEKSDVLAGLEEAVEQVNKAKKNRTKLKSARQLLDEI